MPVEKSKTAAAPYQALPGRREFVITRVFNAPKAMVFKAWIDPKQMAQWWGPHGFTNPVCEMDVRVGGAYRIVMRGPDGKDYPMKGFYREIVPNERIVYTADLSEHPADWHEMVNKGNPPGEIIQTITFDEHDGKTTLTIKMLFESVEARDAHVRLGMGEGWAQSFEKMDQLLANSDSADAPFIISRVFDAPRDLVWKAWTNRDSLMQWFGPKGFTMPKCTLDFRPGGIFHYCMVSPDGREMWGKFVYREIVPPEKIVLVNSFSDADGNVTRHPMSPSWPLQMLTTTTLNDLAGKTMLTIKWSPLNATEAERKTFDEGRKSMTIGWTGTFEQLEAYLIGQKARG